MASLALGRSRPKIVMLILLVLTLAAIATFMTLGARGSWDFVLPFRGRKMLGMVLAGTAIALSTVLFQTITNNRILSPAIMGFDSLYRLIQTGLIFALGNIGLTGMDQRGLFFIETGLMIGFALLLFRILFADNARNLHLLVLAGFIFGALFRSLADFMQRILNPNDFVILQDRTFARFSAIDEVLLGLATFLICGVAMFVWSLRRQLDVVALGRAHAVNLGVNYTQAINLVLVLVAILVSVATALVGPVTFFGLLVANLAYQLLGSARHAFTLPAAALLSIVCLVGGQVVLERVFAFDTSLSIIIEFLGGIVFIALLLKGNGK